MWSRLFVNTVTLFIVTSRVKRDVVYINRVKMKSINLPWSLMRIRLLIMLWGFEELLSQLTFVTACRSSINSITWMLRKALFLQIHCVLGDCSNLGRNVNFKAKQWRTQTLPFKCALACVVCDALVGKEKDPSLQWF